MPKLLWRYIRALRKIHNLEKANRMLAEQLYRADSILKGHPYHRA